MLKWKVLALFGLACGVAGGMRLCATRVLGFYELRIYTAQFGERDALAARFA
jgi:hypothetical protein